MNNAKLNIVDYIEGEESWEEDSNGLEDLAQNIGEEKSTFALSLSVEQENHLIKTYCGERDLADSESELSVDGRTAKFELINALIPLVEALASDYINNSDVFLDYEELVSAGVEGLIKAIEAHPTRSPLRCSKRALKTIRKYMDEVIQDTVGNPIRSSILSVVPIEEEESNQSVLDEVAIYPRDPKRYEWDMQHYLPQTQNDCYSSPQRPINLLLASAEINEKMSTKLTPDQEDVIRKRFGLGVEDFPYGHDMTLREVAQTKGLTQGEVRTLEKNGIIRLRGPHEGTDLKQFSPNIDVGLVEERLF